ncbi:cytochrome c3 family protein [Methanohalobium sp.]|uniref:cytochrome c3 family protein n=1 Tax=Methanohalobium sp. TaxID=2837493 RepID=UPI0025E830DE|nr:cytochrome c3 family protein [Methanohalobium sp.]
MKKYLFIVVTILILMTTTSMALNPKDCSQCHPDVYETWNMSNHSVLNESDVACDVCHSPPEEGYEAHIDNPTEIDPGMNYSAELCGKCHNEPHKPIFDEWDEYSKDDFDTENMTSHSEPSDVTEPFVQDSDDCVACKSTEGAVVNLEGTDVHDFNEEKLPNSSDVEEWRLTCVACHEPHSTGFHIEDEVKLCSNCHNSRGAEPDGETTIARYTQWDMYNNSSYVNGGHPVEIGCVDCHMGAKPFNETTNESAVTGHRFDMNVSLVVDSESTNNCSRCHGAELSGAIENQQSRISSRLQDLETKRDNAEEALEELNGTQIYQEQQAVFNNALYYMTAVEEDGSLGVHNMEMALSYLNNSEERFDEVINAQPPEEEPGFEAIYSIAGLLLVFYLVRRKYSK